MSITDELRKWLKSLYTPNSGAVKDEGERIADRIDAALAERYVELPKDADGEPIHIGDVMESGDGDVFTVSSVDYGLHPSSGRGKFWMLWNEDADFYECAYECRHHKQPTVEDVLRDMCLEIDRRCERGSIDYDELFAEYAAKLRLAKEGE